MLFTRAKHAATYDRYINDSLRAGVSVSRKPCQYHFGLNYTNGSQPLNWELEN